MVKKQRKHQRTSKKGKKYWAGSGVTFQRSGEKGKEYLNTVSGMVKHLEYDDETQDLKVTFKNGSTYVYADVPEKVAESLKTAQSIGRQFNKKIKEKYTYTKLN